MVGDVNNDVRWVCVMWERNTAYRYFLPPYINRYRTSPQHTTHCRRRPSPWMERRARARRLARVSPQMLHPKSQHAKHDARKWKRNESPVQCVWGPILRGEWTVSYPSHPGGSHANDICFVHSSPNEPNNQQRSHYIGRGRADPTSASNVIKYGGRGEYRRILQFSIVDGKTHCALNHGT